MVIYFPHNLCFFNADFMTKTNDIINNIYINKNPRKTIMKNKQLTVDFENQSFPKLLKVRNQNHLNNS